MEVVAVIHEGDGVTAGGPAHESQVLVVVEIILLKVNEVWVDITIDIYQLTADFGFNVMRLLVCSTPLTILIRT